MDKFKQGLLDNLKSIIKRVQDNLLIDQKKLTDLINKPLSEIKSLAIEDQNVFANMQEDAFNRIEELKHLYGSPFFVKCEVEILSTKEKKILYFAKHHFTEEKIYSWIAPIATIRFEKPGQVQYRLPNGVMEKLILNSKEQYLIVDGKVVFFALENIDKPRELIYQEHFSAKKEGFILPEIVAVMEKAQDTVIRAHHIGPFIISGPAGSGKTTLALHRVAFLVQSPDTAHLYAEKSIIVFVQDNGTKEYFSHLLPELGIKNVKITTFFEWGMEILGIDNAVYIDRRGIDENDKISKTFERLKQLSSKDIPSWSETKKFLENNKAIGIDRIDITIALMSFLNHYKRIEIKQKFNAVVKGKIVKKTRTNILKYSLIVMDEFQNYMPEQINIINTCLDENTNSAIYVGDIAQQIVYGALRSWDQIGLNPNSEREVRLHKVYRNTNQILKYIQTLGYKVEIPNEIKEGKEVIEYALSNEQDIIAQIDNSLKNSKGLIGVIAKDIEELKYIQNHFKDEKRIHITSMAMSQGVEFDIVYIIGIDNKFFIAENTNNYDDSFMQERKRITKDLLYVALTRAISELYIIGSVKLSEISQKD